jgi:hypothetical protein
MRDARPLSTEYAYAPVAVYYEDADNLEYVRRDVPAVYRRIDDLLTLVLSMESREPVGFQLKGFKHFYLRYIKDKFNGDDYAFMDLVVILEQAVMMLGNEVFLERERMSAYAKAQDIAKEDEVHFARAEIVA